MTVVVQEVDVGHMTAVSAVFMTGSLGRGTWIGEQVNFTEVVCEGDDLPVVRPDQSVDVGAIGSFRPHPENVESQDAGVRCPVNVFTL